MIAVFMIGASVALAVIKTDMAPWFRWPTVALGLGFGITFLVLGYPHAQ